MWLVVGLGNPGPKYAGNRHNIGFMVIDEIATKAGVVGGFRDKFGGLVAGGELAGQRISLLKPMEYMNLSGAAVQKACTFYQVEAKQVVVVHDEIDLALGTLRVKVGGGHGGHNGLRDAIAVLGDSFWRLRLGIGHPGHRDQVSDYVLTRAPAEEDRLLHEQVAVAADIVPLLLEQGAQKAMLRLHAKPAAARGPAEPPARKGEPPR